MSTARWMKLQPEAGCAVIHVFMPKQHSNFVEHSAFGVWVQPSVTNI